MHVTKCIQWGQQKRVIIYFFRKQEFTEGKKIRFCMMLVCIHKDSLISDSEDVVVKVVCWIFFHLSMPADIICVYVGCGWELGRLYTYVEEDWVAYMGFFGRWEIKVHNGFHIKTFEGNGCLSVQVTEMLCIYCLKALANPSLYASWRERERERF